MRVGVLGSGVVAKTLAAGLLKHNHQVMVGTRTPAKLAEWETEIPGSRIGTFDQAAAHGELIVLAVKGDAATEVLRLAGPQNFKGKTIADATNPIADAPPVNGVLRFFTTHDQSLMEQLQTEFTEANFVKVFNSVGSASMVNPVVPGGKPSMFICGNNQAAKEQVKAILDSFDWETIDMGFAEAARAIEPLCMLWCIPGLLRNEWDHAFKLLRLS